MPQFQPFRPRAYCANADGIIDYTPRLEVCYNCREPISVHLGPDFICRPRQDRRHWGRLYNNVPREEGNIRRRYDAYLRGYGQTYQHNPDNDMIIDDTENNNLDDEEIQMHIIQKRENKSFKR